MFKYLLFIAFTISAIQVKAQKPDSIFAVRKGPGMVIKYTSKPGESVSMLSHRFYIAEDKIESSSQVDGRKKLAPGTELSIPLKAENFTASREPVGMENQVPVYYRVREKDDIPLISLFVSVKKEDIILWNTLHGNTIHEGQALFVGWVKMVPKDSINLMNGIAYPSRNKAAVTVVDTARHAFGELDSLYNVQTDNGRNTITEKGTAVFFEKPGKNNIFYAFHNTTPHGAIIKVTDPGTGKYILCKVLGPIPNTKLYANCVIGICNAAKEALGITEDKAWCELSYSPN